jgi:hypothetical protein
VGAQVFPDGDAEQTPIMHLADFLTESSRLFVIFAFSHFRKKRKRERAKEKKEKNKEKKFIVNSFLLT